MRVLIEDGENRGVRPDAQGIDLLHLAGSESVDFDRVARCASAGRIVAGAKGECARAKGVGGNGADLRNAAGVLALFVVEEIKDAVGDDLSPDTCAELIADQRLARNVGVIVEPGVGGEESVAVVFVERPMELIGAALGDESDLTAGRAAQVRALAGDRDAEFLDRVERNRQDRVKPGVGIDAVGVGTLISAETGGGGLRDKAGVLVVVDVGAIERDVVLIAAGAQDFTAGGDTRLQAEQLHDITRLQRELADLGLAEGIADAGVCGIDLRGFGGYVHDFPGGGQRHLQIESRRSIDEQLDMAVRDSGKTGLFDDQVIVSGSDLEEAVFAVDVGGGFARGTVLGALHGYRGSGNHCAGRIGNSST